ncbi:hypothetical protein FGG08_006419 [Glutinoglossum americanum]|uniref:Uncharacterized protein n=1 Tax=Glutinoglossum americanum TaxID=1670608 RepID=A0A9P8L0Y3_9PEZI|nr:hypothetical protein FGG08_006419 [Glutinoglossum americanum]
MIFKIIRCRNNAIKETPSPDEILQVAIAADKFDYVIPLTSAIKDWLKCADVTDCDKLWRLMRAAYWSGNAKTFNEISLASMLRCKGSYLQLAVQGVIDADVLMRVCVSLEEDRNRLRMELLQILAKASTYASKTCPCGWSGKHSLAHMVSLRPKSWPPAILEKTVWQAAEEGIARYGS